MQDDTVELAFAGFVILAGLGIAALSYIRAVNAIAALNKQKKPAEWQADMQNGGVVRRPAGWIYRQAIRLDTPDIADEDYKRLLSAARNRLLVCIALFMVFVIGVGWSTQGTIHIAPSPEVAAEYKALLARILSGMRPRHASSQLEGAIPSTSLIQPKNPNPIVLPQGPHIDTPDTH